MYRYKRLLRYSLYKLPLIKLSSGHCHMSYVAIGSRESL